MHTADRGLQYCILHQKTGGGNYLNITQDTLINEIARKEHMDAATARKIMKSAENIIFDYLSSAAPSEEITIKLFPGFHIKRKYIDRKRYSKGMFQNIECPEHVTVKVSLSKYYTGQVNRKLFMPGTD